MQNFFTSLNKKRQDIWRYKKLLNKINNKNLLTLHDKFSPLEELKSTEFIFKNLPVFLKREDKNRSGSHKSRSLAYQIQAATERGIKNCVISSSGNAAINAAVFCKLAGLNLTVFIPQKVTENDINKINYLRKLTKNIIITDDASNEIDLLKLKNGFLDLRPSRDNNAIIGFKTLAYELFEQIPYLSANDAVFILQTSGASLLGMFEGFKDLINLKALKSMPQLHLVQGGGCASVSSVFDKRKISNEDQFVYVKIKKHPRKQSLVKAVNFSRGHGWSIKKREADKMDIFLNELGISTSIEGAGALAGLKRSIEKGFSFKRAIVVLTGKKWEKND